MIPRTALLVWVLLFGGAMSSAQSTPPHLSAVAEPHCKTISHGIDHGEALASACEFAQSLLQKLPNAICAQTTERFRGKLAPHGTEKLKRHDVVTATVSYLDRTETYSDVRIDGKAQTGLLKSGAWAAGEYGATMSFIFSEQSAAQFRFTEETALRAVPVVVFAFSIKRENNRQWALAGMSAKRMYPGVKGRLWLDKANGRVLRSEIEPSDLGDLRSMQLSIETNYADVQLGDGSTFLLPVDSVALACNPQQRLCSRNVVTFENCHRFAAKSRVISLSETGENSP